MSLTKKDLVAVLEEALNKKRSIHESIHTAHHEFIQSEIERREDNKKLWMKFQTSIVGTIATGLIAGLLWLGTLVIEAVKPH